MFLTPFLPRTLQIVTSWPALTLCSIALAFCGKKVTWIRFYRSVIKASGPEELRQIPALELCRRFGLPASSRVLLVAFLYLCEMRLWKMRLWSPEVEEERGVRLKCCGTAGPALCPWQKPGWWEEKGVPRWVSKHQASTQQFLCDQLKNVNYFPEWVPGFPDTRHNFWGNGLETPDCLHLFLVLPILPSSFFLRLHAAPHFISFTYPHSAFLLTPRKVSVVPRQGTPPVCFWYW